MIMLIGLLVGVAVMKTIARWSPIGPANGLIYHANQHHGWAGLYVNMVVIRHSRSQIPPHIQQQIQQLILPSLQLLILPSLQLTITPTAYPTIDPTINPTIHPTINPTKYPSIYPTNYPTTNPTTHPTINPTTDPTTGPTSDPTIYPTFNPTKNPTNDPTIDPTFDPTKNPSNAPTIDPTIDPTFDPTKNPSNAPTIDPTIDPTFDPTKNPSNAPTIDPSDAPSLSSKSTALDEAQVNTPMDSLFIYIIIGACLCCLFIGATLIFIKRRSRRPKHRYEKAPVISLTTNAMQRGRVQTESRNGGKQPVRQEVEAMMNKEASLSDDNLEIELLYVPMNHTRSHDEPNEIDEGAGRAKYGDPAVTAKHSDSSDVSDENLYGRGNRTKSRGRTKHVKQGERDDEEG
eukprot:1096051_1